MYKHVAYITYPPTLDQSWICFRGSVLNRSFLFLPGSPVLSCSSTAQDVQSMLPVLKVDLWLPSWIWSSGLMNLYNTCSHHRSDSLSLLLSRFRPSSRPPTTPALSPRSHRAERAAQAPLVEPNGGPPPGGTRGSDFRVKPNVANVAATWRGAKHTTAPRL